MSHEFPYCRKILSLLLTPIIALGPSVPAAFAGGIAIPATIIC